MTEEDSCPVSGWCELATADLCENIKHYELCETYEMLAEGIDDAEIKLNGCMEELE